MSVKEDPTSGSQLPAPGFLSMHAGHRQAELFTTLLSKAWIRDQENHLHQGASEKRRCSAPPQARICTVTRSSGDVHSSSLRHSRPHNMLTTLPTRPRLVPVTLGDQAGSVSGSHHQSLGGTGMGAHKRGTRMQR